jgi:hypothetical protein
MAKRLALIFVEAAVVAASFGGFAAALTWGFQ